MTPMRKSEVGCRGSEDRLPISDSRSPLRPDARLLRPDGVLVTVFERLAGCFKRARIVGGFISRHARPVRRLRGRVGSGQLLADVAELPLGVGEILFRELRVAEAQL